MKNIYEILEDLMQSATDEYQKNGRSKLFLSYAKTVLDSGDSYANYKFALCVKGADIQAHEQVVLKAKNAYTSIDFAQNVKGADYFAHEKVVLASKDKEATFYFYYLTNKPKRFQNEDLILQA